MRLTYATAGVDIAAGEKAVERIKEHVRSTFRREVVGDLGGFGGLFAPDWRQYDDPLLVSSTDGVGTKSLIARLANRRDTIGIDCVAMSVDDIAAQGAEPLFFLDYISVGHLVADEVDEIVAGVAEGCRTARCALLGGEMSEHPGLLAPGEFDLVGFAVGVVDRAKVLPQRVRAGDRIVGLASPGLRCNGYSLARAALLERGGRALDGPAWRRRAPRPRRRVVAPKRDLFTRDVAHGSRSGRTRVRARYRRWNSRQLGAGPARSMRRRSVEWFVGSPTNLSRDPTRRRRRRDGRWNRCSTSVWECSRWSPRMMR